MTRLDNLTYKCVGDLYGCRNWVDYGLKQSKNELGWADFRVTHYAQIEKWWELVMSAYLMVTLHTPPLRPEGTVPPEQTHLTVIASFLNHRHWDTGQGWKNWLNNLRLILLPWVSFNVLKLWLEIFSIPKLIAGFEELIAWMNHFPAATVSREEIPP